MQAQKYKLGEVVSFKASDQKMVIRSIVRTFATEYSMESTPEIVKCSYINPVTGLYQLVELYVGEIIPYVEINKSDIQGNFNLETSSEAGATPLIESEAGIEELQANGAYLQQGYGAKYSILDVGDKINEVIRAINALQKGSK